LALLDIPSVMTGNVAQTKEILEWNQVQPVLITDLEQGYYFNK